MLAFLKALVVLPVAVIVVLFAVANRGLVTLSFDPISKGAPEIAVAVPLYGLLLATLATGILIGGIGAWLSGSRHRRSGRVSRREAHRLRAEADRLRASLATPRVPALPAPGSSV